MHMDVCRGMCIDVCFDKWVTIFNNFFAACRRRRPGTRSNRRVTSDKSRRDAPFGSLGIDTGPRRSPSARPETPKSSFARFVDALLIQCPSPSIQTPRSPRSPPLAAAHRLPHRAATRRPPRPAAPSHEAPCRAARTARPSLAPSPVRSRCWTLRACASVRERVRACTSVQPCEPSGLTMLATVHIIADSRCWRARGRASHADQRCWPRFILLWINDAGVRAAVQTRASMCRAGAEHVQAIYTSVCIH